MLRQRKLILGAGVTAGLLCGLVAFSLRDAIVEAWWIGRLDAGNYLERKAAAENLGALRSARAVSGLLACLVAEATTPPPGPDCGCTGTRDPFHYTPAHVYRDAILAIGPPAAVELRRVLARGPDASRVWAAHLLGTIAVDLASARDDEEEAGEARALPCEDDLGPLVSGAVDSLAAQLGSRHEPLRSEAAAWLANLDAASLPALFRVMESGEEVACESAARAFRRLLTRDAWDVARLKALLENPRPGTRRAGASCLSSVLWEAAGALRRYEEYLERELAPGGPQEDQEDRAWLGRVRGVHDQVERILVRELDAPDLAVRRIAARGLASSERLSSAAIDALAGRLLDPDDQVREAAFEGLSENGARVPLPILLRVLEGGSWSARIDAAGAIGELGAGGIGAAPVLLAALEENDPLRSEAVEGLSAMGLRVLPHLVTALSSESPRARSGAARAIAGIAAGPGAERTTWLSARADAVLRAIIPDLSFRDPALWRQLRDAVWAVSRWSPRGDETLLQLLYDPGEARRLAAACILASRRDGRPRVISELLLGARHESGIVREAAVRGLASVRGEDPGAVLPALLAALEDRASAGVAHAAVSALASWRGRAAEAAPALLRAFRESRLPEVPRSAFQALLNIRRGNPREIAALLLEGVAHPDAGVRHGAGFIWRSHAAELEAAQSTLADALTDVPDRGLPELLRTMVMLRLDLEPAAPVLLGRLRRTPDGEARSMLVMAIAAAARGCERVKSSVLEALGDEKLRLPMIEVLERLGPAAADAVPALRRLGRISDASIQHAVARALEQIETGK